MQPISRYYSLGVSCEGGGQLAALVPFPLLSPHMRIAERSQLLSKRTKKVEVKVARQRFFKKYKWFIIGGSIAAFLVVILIVVIVVVAVK